MSAPYWGQLPPPKVTRGSTRREEEHAPRGSNSLPIDTNAADDRCSGDYPSQSNSRANRFSIQTDAPTISTLSPFASPIASEFHADGLTPRPASFQPDTSYAAYNRDYLEKRRRRQSRDQFEGAPPPAAPDVPRAPPVSYRQPYSSVGLSSSQPPVRSRSTRKSEGLVRTRPEESYWAHANEGYVDQDQTQVRRVSNNSKTSGRYASSQRQDSTSQARNGSLSESEEQKRREWAPGRSPLQKLEVTLDSITKGEKRARAQEAEIDARESRTGPGGERASQNSVRFRNRSAKASDATSQSQPQSLPGAGLVRSLSTKRKDRLQRSGGVVEKHRPADGGFVQGAITGGSDYQPHTNQDTITVPTRVDRTSAPQRKTSTLDRSYIPVTATAAAAGVGGVSQSGSKNLRKEPPGDTWFKKIREAEHQYHEVVAPRNQPMGGRQQATAEDPSRDAAFRSKSESAWEKELPVLPRDATRYPVQDREMGQLDLASMKTIEKPLRREKSTKIERLTGSSNPPVKWGQAGSDIRAERVMANGVQYDVPPTTRGKPSQEPEHHHRLSSILHPKHDNTSGQGVYAPSRRLDDWKRGGVALLSGALLELDVNDQIEDAKDRAWWEAGNTGTRRRSSTKQRKAEAYDGEYDSDGMQLHFQSSFPGECEACTSERAARKHAVSLRTHQSAGYNQKTGNKVLAEFSVRSIRVRPVLAPTRFKPPLFLKSGPMLRYCGMRNEKVQSRSNRNKVLPDREIWRGSIMIVTQDAHSSYELAPTLRLFLQPVDLLPPPPSQVDGGMDDLAAEYVDPLAGLPKLGRDGRTLYIRPIDHLEEVKDLSREESDDGLFEMHRSPLDGTTDRYPACKKSHYDGEKAGKYTEVRGFRLHAEQGVTFWRFNIEIELREKQQRIAYRINRGPATGFWVPARGQGMNIMFSSCNGFSLDTDPNPFCGPDPMWRDVLNTHQTQPFHVMLGGGDQIYNDRVMEDTVLFKQWLDLKDPHHKERLPFTPELQHELETFYLNRYSMWFSQGLFSVAVSQIPMINIFDDHDIIDGFGSYPDSYMRSPIFSGLGSVAFKYYMLFQHQSSIEEGEETEPSWILGTQPGPYIKELSRSVFTTLGREIAFLGLDCRTERMFDEIVSAETYHKVFDRLEKEIIKGQTKHLIVLVGVPVAYPRLVWLENILTSRVMEPIKALSRAGVLGKKLVNHMDGGVEILDDLDDHWTAKHHKEERNWFIQELQDLAAMKSVRVTLLGGDVHLGAIGQFYSNPKLGIPKDHDFRYMPNIISSAIVNSPPPDTLADILNKRNKVHHLDAETDEDMIPIFTHDVNGKPRNNKRLLNRRNWCSIRLYDPELTPPPTPQSDGPPSPTPRGGLLRRLSSSARGSGYRPRAAAPVSKVGFLSRRETVGPPPSRSGFFGRRNSISERPGVLTRTLSLSRKDFAPGSIFRRPSKSRPDDGGINGYGADSDDDASYHGHLPPQQPRSGLRGGSGGYDSDDGYFPSIAPAAGQGTTSSTAQAPTSVAGVQPQYGAPLQRPKFHRTPTGLSAKQLRKEPHQAVNLEGGLDICLNMEVNPKDPAGITSPYRLLVPALWHEEPVLGRESGSSGSSRSSRGSETSAVQQEKRGEPKVRWGRDVGRKKIGG
ncbi:hypothetical protein BUE80_DR008114 [Diplocarpon rosae]|nr:hypothetical protein BUE80_DR008114 [Diplocarpon rosae]